MKISKIFKRGFDFVFDPNYRFSFLAARGRYNNMPDEEFLKKKFKSVMGKELNLNNPQTFNEKLQWLKLYDRKPEYTIMADKYRVRDYIKNTIGEEYLIPLLGVWDDPEEIDFDALPDKFVLKCNHNSGLGMCICKDKSKLNIKKVKQALKKGLEQDYYLTGREWPYKDVPRKIIAEKFMVDESGTELKDYKIMCFNGKAKCSFVCSERFSKTGLKVTFFDREWNRMPFERCYPQSKEKLEKPKNYELMLKLAEQLSASVTFLRVDFYEINGKPYLGELTFHPGSGFEKFSPEEWDYKLGEMLKLPVSEKK